MNRNDARKLADIITNEQIKQMLDNAKTGIKDWTKASVANKGLSRGVHWNIFCKDYSNETEFSNILKYRMIQEYGEFLSGELKQKIARQKKSFGKPVHHDPIF